VQPDQIPVVVVLMVLALSTPVVIQMVAQAPRKLEVHPVQVATARQLTSPMAAAEQVVARDLMVRLGNCTLDQAHRIKAIRVLEAPRADTS
jgi:hypothetical protein